MMSAAVKRSPSRVRLSRRWPSRGASSRSTCARASASRDGSAPAYPVIPTPRRRRQPHPFVGVSMEITTPVQAARRVDVNSLKCIDSSRLARFLHLKASLVDTNFNRHGGSAQKAPKAKECRMFGRSITTRLSEIAALWPPIGCVFPLERRCSSSVGTGQ